MFIFSFSLLIYVNYNNQRVILNVLLVHTWQSARIINYRNPQATFYTSCTFLYLGDCIFTKLTNQLLETFVFDINDKPRND